MLNIAKIGMFMIPLVNAPVIVLVCWFLKSVRIVPIRRWSVQIQSNQPKTVWDITSRAFVV